MEGYSNQINFTNEGIGNDVLFLHGWGGNAESFKAISAKLDGYKRFCIDLPGFGQSAIPHTSWGVEDYADCVAEFVRSNCSKNLTIVGHSFGGRIGVVFAAKYPYLIQKLVLVSAAGLRRYSIKRQFKITVYKIKKRLAKTNKRFCQGVEKIGSADFLATNGIMRQNFVKIINLRLNKFAKKISCPTLLVWGEEDTETPIWMAKKYNKLIKNSGLVILKECGHFCYLQKSTHFCAILRSFLNSQV